jgi:hypothetical protein
MKPQLTQQEMQNYSAQGKTYLWAYKTLYAIQYSDKTKILVLCEIHRHSGKLGITRRGRFMAMTKDYANSLITA